MPSGETKVLSSREAEGYGSSSQVVALGDEKASQVGRRRRGQGRIGGPKGTEGRTKGLVGVSSSASKGRPATTAPYTKGVASR